MHDCLHPGEGNVQRGLLLFLLGHASVQSWELVSQWLQGSHDRFNGGQPTNNIGQRDVFLRILPRA
jgi:hypothetical protein